MAGLVTYQGALRPADVTTSDGKHYYVNPGDTISVPNADAAAMMANSDWAAADSGTATLQPTPAPVVEEAWIVDGVLSKPNPAGPKGWSAVSTGGGGSNVPLTVSRDGSGVVTGVDGATTDITSITRTSGRVSSYAENGVTRTVSRDGNGRVTGVS